MPIVQPTPIDQLPQPPNPADRSNFNSLAYPFTAALLPMTDQINQATSDTYTNALEAESLAGDANASAIAASLSAGEAHDSELAAQAAAALAEGHKDAAAVSAGEAGDSEDAAANAAGQAGLARDKAQQWATETDVVESGLKGSRGYAQDAAQSAADAAAAVQGNFGPAIHAATAKSEPADADELAVTDSESSWELKKLTWGNLKAAIENDGRFVNTIQIKAATGQSADDIMSQKAVTDALAGKQPTLVSGTNIKTLGGQSLLGEGDVPLPNPDLSAYARLDGAVFTRPVLFDQELDLGAVTTANGQTVTINWAQSQNQRLQYAHNMILAFTPPAGVFRGGLKIQKTVSGARSITWPAGSRFLGGFTPETPDTAINSIAMYSVYWDGAAWWITGGQF